MTWQGKEKAETQAYLWNPAAWKSLHTASHWDKLKTRDKTKQKLTSSFRIFTLLRIHPATTTPPTGNTKQGLLKERSDIPHSHQSGNDNICRGAIQDQLNSLMTEKIQMTFQDKKAESSICMEGHFSLGKKKKKYYFIAGCQTNSCQKQGKGKKRAAEWEQGPPPAPDPGDSKGATGLEAVTRKTLLRTE